MLVQTANAVVVLVQLLEDRDEAFSICLHHVSDWGSSEVLTVVLDTVARDDILERLVKMHDKNYLTCLDETMSQNLQEAVRVITDHTGGLVYDFEYCNFLKLMVFMREHGQNYML